jgi:hypothetical protein
LSPEQVARARMLEALGRPATSRASAAAAAGDGRQPGGSGSDGVAAEIAQLLQRWPWLGPASELSGDDPVVRRLLSEPSRGG